ncbi:MAG: hypothetical protein JNL89_07615, partial [Rhodanobacteraceae bacterium]|nr:hypothetical protein [Rhodanobacteraceae bacterium]
MSRKMEKGKGKREERLGAGSVLAALWRSLFSFSFFLSPGQVGRVARRAGYATSALASRSPLCGQRDLRSPAARPLLAALWLSLFPFSIFLFPVAANAATDTPDYLELAAVLASDGNYDKAAVEFAKVDAADPELDAIKYHTLGGLIALNRQQPEAAVKAFEAA